MLPSTQCAIQQDNDGRLRLVKGTAIPPVPPGYVLVKTGAVALNPSDHKILKNFPLPGAFVGADFSGIVVQKAEDVVNEAAQIGTAVSGASFGFSPAHRLVNGAFSDYVRARADLLLRVPSCLPHKQTVNRLEAATLSTAVSTCIISLWSREGLDLRGNPDNPQLLERPTPVLVYGGSTATGTIAVQLLKLSGYDPIATCSPQHFSLVRGRGASAVFDRSDANTVANIKSYTNGTLKYVLDCISDEKSIAISYSAIQRPGGRYVTLERLPEDLLVKRRAVQHSFVLAAEAYGEEVSLGQDWYDRPPNLEKHNLVVRYMPVMQRLLDEGLLKPHPIRLVEESLEGIIKGLDLLASGQVSGQKLVVDIEGPQGAKGSSEP